MPFSWMDRTPPRTEGPDRRTQAATAELVSRAGLLYRLGFSEAAATSRLVARIAWEYEGKRPAALSDKAIASLVTSTFARRPG